MVPDYIVTADHITQLPAGWSSLRRPLACCALGFRGQPKQKENNDRRSRGKAAGAPLRLIKGRHAELYRLLFMSLLESGHARSQLATRDVPQGSTSGHGKRGCRTVVVVPPTNRVLPCALPGLDRGSVHARGHWVVFVGSVAQELPWDDDGAPVLDWEPGPIQLRPLCGRSVPSPIDVCTDVQQTSHDPCESGARRRESTPMIDYGARKATGLRFSAHSHRCWPCLLCLRPHPRQGSNAPLRDLPADALGTDHIPQGRSGTSSNASSYTHSSSASRRSTVTISLDAGRRPLNRSYPTYLITNNNAAIVLWWQCRNGYHRASNRPVSQTYALY